MATGNIVAGYPIVAQDVLDELQATPWASYTPTLSGLTLGNGSVVAAYRFLGKHVDYRFKFTLGSTSAVGSSPTFTAPATPSSTHYAADDVVGAASCLDAAIALYLGVTTWTGTAFRPAVIGTGSTYATNTNITSAIPMTWGNGDKLTAWGSYIAA